MKTLHEATDSKIKELAVTPGTHYFVVESWKLASVRAKLYAAVEVQQGLSIHTSYNRVSRTLRINVDKG